MLEWVIEILPYNGKFAMLSKIKDFVVKMSLLCSKSALHLRGEHFAMGNIL